MVAAFVPGEATIYCEKEPDFIFNPDDGMVYVVYDFGREGLRLVFRPCVFRRALRNANRVSDEIGETRVVPLRRKR